MCDDLPPQDDAVSAIDGAVAALRREPRPLVLAVSGGLDSMVLLDSAARLLPDRIAAVATFDHRTGRAARAASRLVVRQARARGLQVEAAVSRRPGRSEAEWRRARWHFLHDVARRVGGTVVTAHTQDDQVETVLLRALRHAGPRGLAALHAPGAIRRPLLAVRREQIARYALARGVAWVDDPSNASLAFRRNRVRHELLPALRRVHPDIDRELLALSARAAIWRRDVEAVARAISACPAPEVVHVAIDSLRGYDRAGLAMLWPAVAARAGLALDRRGTERLVGFTMAGVAGGRIQLAGGWQVAQVRDRFVLRRASPSTVEEAELPLTGVLRWGRWSFFRRQGPAIAGDDDVWEARLPAAPGRMTVRGWMPGDRMRGADGRPRRVKRFLRDAGIAGVDRAGWPVVVADGEIVWIPGVRRSDAATARSGRPAVSFSCEFDDWGAAGR